MTAAPLNAGQLREQSSQAVQLVCAEVQGGNRPIDAPLELPGLQGMLYSRPCHGGRGGDVHYASICGSGLLARICLADVVGHGEEVAGVSATMHVMLRRLMNWPDQRRVLRRLNTALHQEGLRALTTLAAITYYPPSRRLSVSYAGHPPGWYFDRGEQRWSRLLLEPPVPSAAPGFIDGALAVVEEATFTQTRRRVQHGDRLVLLTDGILEAPGPGGEQFGAARMESLLQDNCNASPVELGPRILAAVQSHCGRSELDHDDVTFLVIEFVPGPPGPALWHVVRNRLFRRR